MTERAVRRTPGGAGNRRRVDAVRVSVLALLALSATLLAQNPPQPPAWAIAITSPLDGSFVSGPVPVQIELKPEQTGPVRVAVYADGQLICSLDRPPWQCMWQAGDMVKAHELRAVAAAADRRKVVHTIRTSDAGYTEHTDVDAVQVTVTVTDSAGNNVSGLTRRQFRVYEDDVPQTIDYFAGGNASLEIVTAIDISGSMTESMPQLKRSVKAFLAALRPEDRVSLLAFNDLTFSLSRSAGDPAARAKAIDQLEAWGGTALYDVTLRSIETLGRQRGRRAMVIFTDGEDTSSRTTLPLVEQRLERSDAVVYTIGQGRGTTAANLKDVLGRLATKSGGRAFFTEDISRLEEAFNRVLDDLAHQYLLSYAPPSFKRDGAWHRIKVQVENSGYTVRAREGYRAPAR